MPEYNTWIGMKERCYNPNLKAYPNYGGRGITVAAEWLHDFDAFLEHVGPKPSSKHSIDRIDNNNGYRPGNVRWATRAEQANNRRDRPDVCIAGHDISRESDNTWLSKQGYRHCRACHRDRLRERSAAGKRTPLTDEAREKHNAVSRERRQAKQDASVAAATRRGGLWSLYEVSVALDTRLSHEEVASITGRTCYAVALKRTRLHQATRSAA